MLTTTRLPHSAARLLLIGMVLFATKFAMAADFQVDIKRLSVTQCLLSGSLLNIDPATGKVTIDISTDVTCYPSAINAMAANANIAVTGATTVGGGQTGQGTVNLQLNTGLTGVTNGVTCTPDGVTASNVTVVSGWTASLCTNCGPAATRAVVVQNQNNTSNGTITFRAKCAYQDPGNANLQTVRSNIVNTQTVTVLPGSIPAPTYCQSVSELANPKGLTDAMRQPSGNVTLGLHPGTGIDFLNYTSVFGFAPNTYVAGNPDTAGYGFPGSYYADTQFSILKNKFIAMKFRAPSNPSWIGETAKMRFVPDLGFTQISIGKCPGQFGSDANFPMNGACTVVAKQQDLNWMITTGSTSNCKLEPGEIYYLNFINASGSDLTQSTCPSSACSLRVNHTGIDPH